MQLLFVSVLDHMALKCCYSCTVSRLPTASTAVSVSSTSVAIFLSSSCPQNGHDPMLNPCSLSVYQGTTERSINLFPSKSFVIFFFFARHSKTSYYGHITLYVCSYIDMILSIFVLVGQWNLKIPTNFCIRSCTLLHQEGRRSPMNTSSKVTWGRSTDSSYWTRETRGSDWWLLKQSLL